MKFVETFLLWLNPYRTHQEFIGEKNVSNRFCEEKLNIIGNRNIMQTFPILNIQQSTIVSGHTRMLPNIHVGFLDTHENCRNVLFSVVIKQNNF